MRKRILTTLVAATMAGGSLAAPAAQAAVTTQIGGDEAGGASNGGLTWSVAYDDTTRNVTATASGSGFCLVTIQVTATISRTVAFFPVAGGTSQNPDLAAMSTADFQETDDGAAHTLLSNIPPNQMKRLLGKATETIGGLQFTSEWSRI